MYIIQPGDSLWSIAERYHVSFQQLAEANPGIHPGNLRPGQQVYIPISSNPPVQGNIGLHPQSGQLQALDERLSNLENQMNQIETIVDYHRRQIAELNRIVNK